MLESSQVVEIIEYGVSDRISKAREYADIINTNITGKGVEDVLEKLNDYESPHQKKIRQKIVKSNKSLFSFLTRPIDKVFTAKGGEINYNLKDSTLDNVKDILKSVNDGLTIKEYLKKKIKLNYIIDPNGFVMIDINGEGEFDLKFFSTKNLLWYDNTGNTVNAVVFDFFNSDDPDDDKKYYRVVDESTDSIYVQDGDKIYQDESTIKENFLGYVPAFIVGDIYDVNEPLFLSVVDDVLEDSKEHLRDVSVNTVHKLSHGYAKYWQYPESCTDCGGSGYIKQTITDEEGETKCVDSTCYSCSGSGVKKKKTASDVLIVPIPDEDGKVLAPDVGGYINPSIEIWRQYNEDILNLKQSMFQSLWGATFSIDSSNETATGRLINVQPEAERVSGISETFSKIHNFILDAFTRLILQKKDHKTNVSYGTRYLMESPDEILKTYTESIEKGSHISVQNYLLDRFFQTEHVNNSMEYSKVKKIISVDPFPNNTVQELREIGVSSEDLLLKIYYPQWSNTLDEGKRVLMTVEELKADLVEFVKLKKINDVTKEVQQNG